MTGFTESLEQKANQIIKNFNNKDWDNSIPVVLKREIALTLDQIKQSKEFHEKQISEITNTECSIGTDIMQTEDRTPRYSSAKYPEIEKFQRQLLGVQSEKRRQEMLYEDKLQNLQRNLLGLIHKYEQISNIND